MTATAAMAAEANRNTRDHLILMLSLLLLCKVIMSEERKEGGKEGGKEGSKEERKERTEKERGGNDMRKS